MATAPGEGKPMPASPMVPASLLAVLGKLRVFTAPGLTTAAESISESLCSSSDILIV
ncbi:hypothetical protein [Streptomyces mirabilis]|uniref:hypothetical protein n=1 Tax=Streptomyces mirabilis TaxID=68239 RepID=UPI0033A9C4F9